MTSRCKSTIVGIDLGTTFSLVSVMRGDGPVVLTNGIGEVLTPSAVSVADDGSILVGAAAKARATTHPTRTALAFKRDMGTDRVYDLGLKKFSPQELSSFVLASLKRDAEAALGEAVVEAVVTVPAYFGDAQRQATKDAGAIAGLKVERIINEPTAAALAYGLERRSKNLRAVVLDLGGGTFDVTVLRIEEGVIEIQGSAGDARLGGEDFDDALAGLVATRMQAEQHVDVRSDPRSWARVREACERAKRRLSEAQEAPVVLLELPIGRGKMHDIEIVVRRDEAEAAWASVLDRVRQPIARALRDAGIRTEQVEEVLLVGGSTRMPCVVRLASQVFGRLPSRQLPPDEAVALGAAVQAALKADDAAVEDVVVTDVAPFTLGTSVMTTFAGHRISGRFSPILERATTIPCSRVHRYATSVDDQEKIEIEVYQGEHASCEKNTLLGGYTIEGIRKGAAGSQEIDVRFTYDLNGLLEVETTVVATGAKKTLVLERTPGRLTPDEIARAREGMKALKFHAREALPNATALERAEALYVDLRGPVRSELGELIAAFRMVLEGQDRKQIEDIREKLVRFVQAHR
jgi:molecular chaperone HscC